MPFLPSPGLWDTTKTNTQKNDDKKCASCEVWGYISLDFTGKTTRITGRLAEHRRFKTKSTSVRWALCDRSSGRRASDDTQSEPIRQRKLSRHASSHVTYPSCAVTAGQEMWDKVPPFLSQRSVSKRAWHSYPSSPPKMPLFIPKTPENPLLSVPCPSLERFFLEMWETIFYEQLLEAAMLLWFDDGSSASCLSTLHFPAFEFAGHNKTLHVHRPERRIN